VATGRTTPGNTQAIMVLRLACAKGPRCHATNLGWGSVRICMSTARGALVEKGTGLWKMPVGCSRDFELERFRSASRIS
jgi:hypothetical protein